MNETIRNSMAILGKRVEDKVTGLKGVATSVCFDLYGCIQVTVHPGLASDGKPQDCCWYDIARLKVLSNKTVMDVPEFARDDKGPAEKPTTYKM